MKKILQLLLISLLTFQFNATQAQTPYVYGNEWINANQEYWKFSITADGVYKIDYNKLVELGLQNIPGAQFAIYNLGKEVPLYVTTNGVFGTNDYILFQGERKKMDLDKNMYVQKEMTTEFFPVTYNANPYFLTHSVTSANNKFIKTVNSLPLNETPGDVIKLIRSVMVYGTQNFYNGKSYSTSNTYVSSNYDLGENFTATNQIYGGGYEANIQNFNRAPNKNIELYFNIFNSGTSNNNFVIKFNNNIVLDTVVPAFSTLKRILVINSSIINNGNNTFRIDGTNNYFVNEFSSNIYQQPRLSNVNLYGGRFLTSQSQNYFEFIDPYLNPGVTALIFDNTNLKLYEITSLGQNHRLMFSPSTIDRDMTLVRSDLIRTVGTIKKTIISSTVADLNKNYIILTDSSFINASPNYVQQYVNYRNTPEGGNFIAGAIDVTQLYDLFGYGHEFHPLAIKNFIRYAIDNWSNRPTHLFILGKGLQPHLFSSYKSNPASYNFVPIPTWGHPGSDNLFSSFSTNGKTFPELATGRVSARNNQEIGDYLEKVKAYEAEVKLQPSIDNTLWKKEVLHIAGGGDINLQNSFIADLNQAKSIIEDTLLNARVTTIYKRTTDPMTQNADRRIDSFIDKGVRYITFYGHASSSGFDYNLNSPEIQNNKPKYPIFSAYGCDVADIYLLSNTKTISENYISSKNGGSIAMIASNNLGWTSVIPYHMQGLYKEFAHKSYYKTLGEQYNANIHFINNNYINEFFNIHTQSFILQGDPGLQLGNPSKPDLAIEEQYVSINPANVNITSGSFSVSAQYFNIGMSTKDSFWIKIQHIKLSNNQLLFTDSVKTIIGLTDSIKINIPLSEDAVGLTRVNIKLDQEESIDELFESNNEVNVDVNIYQEDLVPIYPYEYSIINDIKVTLKASTLNTMATNNKYIIEFDTTENFNSNLKQTHRVTSNGGTIKWSPNGTLLDSTVYYWRTAIDTTINGSIKWNNSSFIVIKDGYPGWNQSHYFQMLKDKNIGIKLNASNRKFEFSPHIRNYKSTNLTVFNSSMSRQNEIHDGMDGATTNIFSCWFGWNTIQIGIFDSLTGEPYDQQVYCRASNMVSMNEFHVNAAATRNSAMQFLRNIPPGHYVSVKNIVFQGNYNGSIMSPVSWQADTAIYGSGNSLYHALKELGFTDIDQTNTTERKTFLFFAKKGDANFTPAQKVSIGDEKIYIDVDIETKTDDGKLRSVDIGPASKWESFHWNLSTLDNQPQNDTSFVQIFGLDQAGAEVLMYNGVAHDTTLNFIDAATYPKLRLVWTVHDTINKTSQHLDYWRIHYQPLPEAALNPVTLFEVKNDSVGYGENLSFKIAVENISDYDMDSMLVRYRVVDQNNVSHPLENVRYKKLVAGDTVNVGLDVDIRNFSGLNYLFVEANPFNDQPEQFHPNNIGAFPFYVYTDNRNPLLDVTFDGIRILDKDIVSSKPFIKILLNDENENLLLKDTSLFELHLAAPSNISNPIRIPIDGNICKFYPAIVGTKNEAYLEYKPELLEDGIYKLIVKAKDNSGNRAGNFDKYEVNFTVDNTPGITNLLNYPNPFSTSTAFVFTLTGHQIPSQFKIQILSVTGKVVKEITKEELGPLHIGRNITQYKWDGKDQYGQLLGNGVYLYRVITHINGEKLEHRANKNVDKYFKEGYGKMYIMR